MLKQLTVTSLFLASLCQSAHALEFQAVGAGALGVGGAGVARTSGAMSPYWNPAGLAFAEKTTSISLTAGVGLEPERKLADDIENLSNAYTTWNANQSSIPDLNNLVNAVAAVSPSDNLRATADSALGIQIKHLGLGVFGTFEGGAIPHTSPINPTSVSTVNATLANNSVTSRGIGLIEVPISYGQLIDTGKYGKIGLGVTAKYIYGVATSSNMPIFNTVNGTVLSSQDLTKDFSNNLQNTSSWGVDVGGMWKPGNLLLLPVTIGIVGKNLNAPSFSTKDGDKISDDPQVRAGLSVEFAKWLDVVCDIDVIKNPTTVPGLKTQQLGGGIELHPFESLRLRVGGFTDLSDSGSAVTAGISAGIPWAYIDLDGAYGLGTVRYNNASYPSEAKAQFSMNFAF